MQSSKFSNDEGTFDPLPTSSDTYNCVSSAQKRQPTPNHLAMIPRGHLYIVKIRGPRNEPRGTPHNKLRTSNKAPWTDTLWERSFKYDCNHSSTLPAKPNISFPIDEKEHNGQLHQMQQTGPEGLVLMLYFDQWTSYYHFSHLWRPFQQLLNFTNRKKVKSIHNGSAYLLKG